MLINLAVNARDAMGEGGMLTIQTDTQIVDDAYAATMAGVEVGRYVRVRVSDTGTGMTPDVVEHAFEPFFTTKPKGEGSGLGLALVYGTITQSGGYIQIYSEPGLGTRFSILLPASTQEVPTIEQPVVTDVAGDGETILVVEDEAGVRDVTTRILARNGYRVLSADSGAAAVALVEHHDGPIDLLLSDVIMPHMLGKEVAERVSALRTGIRVLYMSGYAKPILGDHGPIEAGVALVEKPFSEKTLLTKVREALEEDEPNR
jgi:CheY-like chemotaxis protein